VTVWIGTSLSSVVPRGAGVNALDGVVSAAGCESACGTLDPSAPEVGKTRCSVSGATP